MTDARCHAARLAAAAITLAMLWPVPAAQADVDCRAGLFAATEPDGIGGTGQSGGEGGIGGTGMSGGDDGVGGTGFGGEDDGIGGTGLLGTITGLASICVNGFEVHYGPDVPFRVGDRLAAPRFLGVGQVVWVVAQKRDGRLEAESIALVVERVGRVGNLDPAARTVEVAGEIVHVLDGAVILGVPGGRLRLAPGSNVAVSGLRRPDGRIAASRIDGAAPGAPATPMSVADVLSASAELGWVSIEGYLGASASGAGLELAGLPLDTAQLATAQRDTGPLDAAPFDTAQRDTAQRDTAQLGATPAVTPAAVGDRVWVAGVFADGVLHASRIVPQWVDGETSAPLPETPGQETTPTPKRSGGAADSAATPPADGTLRRPPPPGEALLPGPVDLPEIREVPTFPDAPDIRDVPVDPGRSDAFEGSSGR